jgi:hypothetical protein
MRMAGAYLGGTPQPYAAAAGVHRRPSAATRVAFVVPRRA